MGWDQWLILVTGTSAIGLSQIGGKWARWACIAGLSGQAGWFYASWTAEQWGIFASCFLYAAMWMIGFYRHWLSSWLNMAMMPTAAQQAGLASLKARAAAVSKRPRLTLVK